MAVSVVQTPDHNNLPGVVRPIAAMCFLAYPLVDTLRVFTIRVLLRRSPFSPDRRHIHHLLMKLGWGHRLSSSALWMYTLLFVVLALKPNAFWAGLSVTEQFLVLLGLAFAVASVPYLLVRTGVGQSSLSQEGFEENDESNAPQGPRRVA
jgi:hypothetical protein